MALKLAIDREAMVRPVAAGLRHGRQRFPDLASPIRTSRRTSSSASTIRKRRRATTQKSGHSGPILLQVSEVAFPGAVDAAVLYQQQAAKAGIRSRSSASPATATGTRCGTSSPSAPPIGAAGRRRTACIPPPIIRRRTGTTRASSTRTSTSCCLQARGELDEAKRTRALPRHGGDGARRGRADPADVQRLHRRALPTRSWAGCRIRITEMSNLAARRSASGSPRKARVGDGRGHSRGSRRRPPRRAGWAARSPR